MEGLNSYAHLQCQAPTLRLVIALLFVSHLRKPLCVRASCGGCAACDLAVSANRAWPRDQKICRNGFWRCGGPACIQPLTYHHYCYYQLQSTCYTYLMILEHNIHLLDILASRMTMSFTHTNERKHLIPMDTAKLLALFLLLGTPWPALCWDHGKENGSYYTGFSWV